MLTPNATFAPKNERLVTLGHVTQQSQFPLKKPKWTLPVVKGYAQTTMADAKFAFKGQLPTQRQLVHQSQVALKKKVTHSGPSPPPVYPTTNRSDK